jgi:predicted ABC-type transport system involved in lysophospholipase L1 biosynthesis ATPase subunit
LLARTSALDNVMMPLGYTARQLSKHECRKRAKGLLERVGLGERLDHQPSQLSGGQQQRVAIARSHWGCSSIPRLGTIGAFCFTSCRSEAQPR